MLYQDQDPFRSFVNKACDHLKSPITSLDSPHIKVLSTAQGDSPLIAWLETGCSDPEFNKDLPPDSPVYLSKLFFVADRFIGGYGADAKGPFLRLAGTAENAERPLAPIPMLPWYEKAIRKYFLPEGWTVKDWVFTTPHGHGLPYCRQFKVYFNGDHDIPEAVIVATLANFRQAYARVNLYVNEVIATTGNNDRRTDRSFPNAEAEVLVDMRNLSIPRTIERTAIDLVLGRDHDEITPQWQRQALVALVHNRMNTPIPVFVDHVYKV